MMVCFALLAVDDCIIRQRDDENYKADFSFSMIFIDESPYHHWSILGAARSSFICDDGNVIYLGQ